MDYIIKVFLPRALQDGLTALAAYLATHGFITSDQTQGFIGSAFFLIMIVANRFFGDASRNKAAVAGGMAVAAASSDVPTSQPVVKQIIEDSKK